MALGVSGSLHDRGVAWGCHVQRVAGPAGRGSTRDACSVEAQASSEIENIVTTTDALFPHSEDDAQADPATKEALRYRSALRAGFDHVRWRGLSTSVDMTPESGRYLCELWQADLWEGRLWPQFSP